MRARARIIWTATVLLAGCSSGGGGGGDDGPRAPASLTARREGAAVRLDWKDKSRDEDGFSVERAAGVGQADWMLLAETDADVPTYLDEDVDATTTYRYRVRSRKGDERSSASGEVKIEPPGFGGTGGCGIVLGDELTRPPIAALVGGGADRLPGAHGDRFWMWALHPEEQVVASTPYAGAGRTIILDGGADGAVDLSYERRERGARLEIELILRFHPFEADVDGARAELCLMFHDLLRGDYAANGLHAADREAVVAALPWGGDMPVEPGREYELSILVDRARGCFDLRADGLRMATDVPLDGVLVLPAVYVHR